MVRLTLIARSRDGLPLAEGLDADKEHEMYAYKSQAKVGHNAHTAAARQLRAAKPPTVARIAPLQSQAFRCRCRAS